MAEAVVTNIRWQRTPVRDEGSYLPVTMETLTELRARLVAAGHPAATVNGLLGWLVAKSEGDHFSTSRKTSSKYRTILRELDASDPVRSAAA